LPLPPYAPQLNPIENVLDYLRGNKLSKCVWDTYEAIVDACSEAWMFLVNDLERIDSIAHRSWACQCIGPLVLFEKIGLGNSRSKRQYRRQPALFSKEQRDNGK